MAIPDAWNPDSESENVKMVKHIEVNGKLQPAPEGTDADLTIIEETLWKGEIAKGAFKTQIEELKLTNLREMRGAQYVMLKDCDKIVAVNVTKKFRGSVGDVQFIKQGSPTIVFAGVKDPENLAEMAIAANEKVLAMIRDAEEKHAAERIACSQCGMENPARAKFCNRCGRPL